MAELWFSLEKVGYPFMEINLEGVICCLKDTNHVTYVSEERVILSGARGVKVMKLADICLECIPKKYHKTFIDYVFPDKKDEEEVVRLPKITCISDMKNFTLEEKQQCHTWLTQNCDSKLMNYSGKPFLHGWMQTPDEKIILRTHNGQFTPNNLIDIFIRRYDHEATSYQIAKELDTVPSVITNVLRGNSWKVVHCLIHALRKENGVN